MGQFITKKDIVPLSAMFIAGAGDGMAEVLRYHYPAFKLRHPNANDAVWNPALSWKNKYIDYDGGNLGEPYPFAQTALVAFSDPYHGFRFVRNTGVKVAIVFKFGEKITFKEGIKDLILYSGAYAAGFWVTYEIIYK